MDKIEKYIIESGDEIGSQLDQHKISIYDWNDKIVKVVKQIEKLKKKGKNSANKAEIQSKLRKNSRIELAKEIKDEFGPFEQDLKLKLKEIKTQVDQRKDTLVTDVENFESGLTQVEANRLKNSRGKFISTFWDFTLHSPSLQLCLHVILEQLKKQVETSHNYLSKEVKSVEHRLYITKEMMRRDTDVV